MTGRSIVDNDVQGYYIDANVENIHRKHTINSGRVLDAGVTQTPAASLNGSMTQWRCGSVVMWVQWFSDSVGQWLSGSVAQWLSGSVVQWFSGSVVQWLSGSVVQWFSGSVARWHGGSVARWLNG